MRSTGSIWYTCICVYLANIEFAYEVLVFYLPSHQCIIFLFYFNNVGIILLLGTRSKKYLQIVYNKEL